MGVGRGAGVSEYFLTMNQNLKKMVGGGERGMRWGGG